LGAAALGFQGYVPEPEISDHGRPQGAFVLL